MNRKNRILIIGDAMIDTYIYGSVSRVSPEAPVPVICPSKEEHCLGGAANVARNAATLGADVTAMFIVGADREAEILKTQLDSYGVECNLLIRDEEQRTINKVRIVGNKQQIVRIDYYDRYEFSEILYAKFVEAFQTTIEKQDIVIISDYGKGTCTELLCKTIIKICNEKNKPVIVDPKGTDWEKYRGASVITPNMKEVNLFSGKQVENESSAIELAYSELSHRIGVDYLLLTRSECGMSLFGEGEVLHIPTQAQAVYDVSGAGDTVVAALAVMLNPKLDNIIDAVRIANIAAGIVVAKAGTAVVERYEIQNEINRENKNDKIFLLKDYERLMQTLKFWKTAGEKVVTTNGCFDLVHRGHVKLLQEAKTLGDRLIVAINSDASVKRLKGESRPINAEIDRAYVLSALGAVDAVVLFDPKEMPDELSDEEKKELSEKAIAAASEAPMKLMRMINPDVHVKGGDYKKEDIPEAIFASELAFIEFEDGYSTTNLICKSVENK